MAGVDSEWKSEETVGTEDEIDTGLTCSACPSLPAERC